MRRDRSSTWLKPGFSRVCASSGRDTASEKKTTVISGSLAGDGVLAFLRLIWLRSKGPPVGYESLLAGAH
jgi:hypothetical protein